jgi:hypothetical protein
MKKVKQSRLQAWSGPEVSRKLRFSDFMTEAQDDGKVLCTYTFSKMGCLKGVLTVTMGWVA